MYEILSRQMFGRTVTALVGPSVGACVDREHGMNLLSLTYRGRELLHVDRTRIDRGATYGVPVLFPTPNRVRDNVFLFAGKRYPATMHGTVRNARFSLVGTEAGNGSSKIQGRVLLGPEGIPDPFPCVLDLTIEVSSDSVQWRYRVTNTGDGPLGYGFGLHPLFRKFAGMVITSDFDGRMEASDELLPTGTIIPTARSPYDFSQGKDIGSLSLDTVFCKQEAPVRTRITYQSFELEMECSRQFGHTVLYTEPQFPFVCVEPQTCSTDCHNLHAQGFERESGLQVIPPGAADSGYVTFRFTPR